MSSPVIEATSLHRARITQEAVLFWQFGFTLVATPNPRLKDLHGEGWLCDYT